MKNKKQDEEQKKALALAKAKREQLMKEVKEHLGGEWTKLSGEELAEDPYVNYQKSEKNHNKT